MTKPSAGKPKRKGSAHERKLANELWDMGCAVLRGCSSGGGVRKRYVPDVVAICGGKILVFELKYRGKPATVKLERDKTVKLLEFSRRCGGRAFLAVKFGKMPWKVVEVKEGVVVSRENYCSLPELTDIVRSCLSHSLEEYL